MRALLYIYKISGEGHGGAVSSGIWSTGGDWSPDSVGGN